MDKSQALADIGIAVLSATIIFTCWDSEGHRLFQAGLVWAGSCVGYLITTYIDHNEEE
jgi:hypothetical protein